MEKFSFVGKNLEEAISEASNNLNLSVDKLIIRENDVKQGLFKSKKVEIEVIRKSDVIEFIKETLENLISLMGLETKFEIKERNDNTLITIFSDNNNILIGKQGRTVEALSLIIKQAVYNEIGSYFNFVLDVGDYRVKHQSKLERLAKKIANEVHKTQIEVKLDSMNSYERRIIHSILSEDNRVYTESTGTEPNRCVVIKPNGK